MNEYIKEIEEIASKCSCSQSDGYAQIMRICEVMKDERINNCEDCLNTEYIQDKLSESCENGYSKAIEDMRAKINLNYNKHQSVSVIDVLDMIKALKFNQLN